MPSTRRRKNLTNVQHPAQVATFESRVLLAGANYSFDNLADGQLVGKDGWYADTAASIPSPNIVSGSGFNTSKVVTGTTAGTRAIRRFDTTFFAGNETSAAFQFDVKVGPNWSGVSLALTGDAGTRQNINGNDVAVFSPKVSVYSDPTSGKIVFTVTPKNGAAWGTGVSFTENTAGAIVEGDWLQVTLRMDFTSNNGAGSGVLYYKNMSRPVGGVVAEKPILWMNLGLNSSSSLPATWRQMWMRNDATSGGGTYQIDNIVVAANKPGNYTFEKKADGSNFVNGALVGQDGWYLDAAGSIPSPNVATGSGVNSSKVVAWTTVGTRAIRRFDSTFYAGNESSAVFQFDVKVGPNWSGVSLALTSDAGSRQNINGNDVAMFSPKVSVYSDPTSGKVMFTVTPKNGAGWGTGVSFIENTAGAIVVGDWLQVTLRMDFTANNGAGAGVLLYKSISRPDANGVVAEKSVVTLNLGLSPSSSGPATWRQAWMRSDGVTTGAYHVDNFVMAGNGPGGENFEGARADRYLRVYDYTSGTAVAKILKFADFVPLLASHSSAQGLAFNDAYIPNTNNTAQFADVVTDPLNSNNQVIKLTNYLSPINGQGRNELHLSQPYVQSAQANGTQYTLAFKFYTSAALPSGGASLMQGYSEFPWLRIFGYGSNLVLDLAKSSSSNAATATPDLDTEPGENPPLGTFNIGAWNTVVLKVIHSNVATGAGAGKIQVYVNGTLRTTYNGRTTYLAATPGVNANIPWMKFGPYSHYGSATMYYDDVSFRPDNINPFTGTLTGSSTEPLPSVAAAKISEAQLTAVIAEAKRRWLAAGVLPSRFADVSFTVSDLGGTALGVTEGKKITIDDDAAGRGWFVDSTPANDSEFFLAGDQGEQGRYDLLTTVMHEMGHTIGLEHSANPVSVMNDSLQTSVRRAPVVFDLAPAAENRVASFWRNWLAQRPAGVNWLSFVPPRFRQWLKEESTNSVS